MNGRLCTWCGHADHARVCPDRIELVEARAATKTRRARPAVTAPCPCARNHHLLTEGLT